jgi:hypothetical protein
MARLPGCNAAQTRSPEADWRGPAASRGPPALSVFDRQLGVADDFLPPLGIAVDVLRELLRRT